MYICLNTAIPNWQITKCAPIPSVVSATVECDYLSLCYVTQIAQHTQNIHKYKYTNTITFYKYK